MTQRLKNTVVLTSGADWTFSAVWHFAESIFRFNQEVLNFHLLLPVMKDGRMWTVQQWWSIRTKTLFGLTMRWWIENARVLRRNNQCRYNLDNLLQRKYYDFTFGPFDRNFLPINNVRCAPKNNFAVGRPNPVNLTIILMVHTDTRISGTIFFHHWALEKGAVLLPRWSLISLLLSLSCGILRHTVVNTALL